MAKEYIIRDEMIEQTKARVVLGAPKFNAGLEAAIEVATSIPAADVVEVVRCCECVYHDDESQYHYCRKWGRNCPDDSDFFCKWGKRMNGGQDDAG